MGAESGQGSSESKRSALKRVYEHINDVTAPGDVVFFVSRKPENPNLSLLRKLYRRWQGFADEDRTNWHTTMFTEARKEKRGAQKRPYILHAIQGGVEEIHIPPSFFTSERTEAGDIAQHGRIEIIQNPDLSPGDREGLLLYAREQLGKPFADLDWRQDILTYAFGLPARPLNPEKASCHGLVFNAYDHIGFSFSHQLKDAPVFNPGRHLGHPLGEDPQRANVKRLYLHDHHLYRDPRFICVLSIFEDPESGEVRTAENPGKYSWDQGLQKKYSA